MPRDDLAALFNAARDAQRRAYAPYSGYKVGAALRGGSGSIHTGCNVENAAYPVGTCAEQGAISAMVAAGEHVITEVLVIGDGAALTTPCGACRQRIREFAGPETPIHIADLDGVRATFTQSSLLPESFGPDNLAATRRD